MRFDLLECLEGVILNPLGAFCTEYVSEWYKQRQTARGPSGVAGNRNWAGKEKENNA